VGEEEGGQIVSPQVRLVRVSMRHISMGIDIDGFQGGVGEGGANSPSGDVS